MNEEREKRTANARKRKRRQKIRRDAIITIADQMFIESRYDQIKVEDIAKKAEYTKATIYNYFKTKEEVFTAVLAKIYERLLEIMTIRVSAARAGEELRAIGDAYLIFTEKYPGQARLVDSGRCVLIHRKIMEKEETGNALTESEQELKEIDAKIEQIMIRVINQTINETGIGEKLAPSKFIMVLSALPSAIQMIIRKGKSMGQSDEEIRKTVAILFNIIEQGVKQYS